MTKESKLPSSKEELLPSQTPLENIENLILNIRGKQVMLDRDLARLYGVETKVLNQAVKRNIERFPEDFMFQLTNEEFENNLRSQIVTSSFLLHFHLIENKIFQEISLSFFLQSD